jgi:hypothetical protein
MRSALLTFALIAWVGTSAYADGAAGVPAAAPRHGRWFKILHPLTAHRETKHAEALELADRLMKRFEWATGYVGDLPGNTVERREVYFMALATLNDAVPVLLRANAYGVKLKTGNDQVKEMGQRLLEKYQELERHGLQPGFFEVTGEAIVREARKKVTRLDVFRPVAPPAASR